MDSLIADLRYAFRWLRRSPMFALIAITSLAIGIGFNAALFAVVDAVLFRPLPVDRPDRLIEIYTLGTNQNHLETTSYPDYLDLVSRNSVLSGILGYSPSIDAIKTAGQARIAVGEVVTGNYFQLLGVKAVLGRTLLPSDDRPGAPRAAVVSYAAWQRNYGGSPSVLNETLRIHGQPYSIVGVIAPAFTGMLPVLQPEVWTPMAWVEEIQPAGIQSVMPSEGKTRLERRGDRWMFLKGRLKDGETFERAGANLQVVMGQLASAYPKTNEKRRISVVPTANVHLHPDADRMLRPVALGLMTVVGLVLLVACANVASMLLARASGRQKEVGVRLAIGASRGRLVRQLLTESALLAALGAAAGTALAWMLVHAINAIQLPIPLPIGFGLYIDGRVLAFTIAVSAVAGLVAGLAPALRATRPDLVSELKGDLGGAVAGGRRWTLGDGLVAAQIAVTLVLLVAAGLLTRSLVAAQRIGLGFEPRGLVALSTELNLIGYDDDRAKQFYARAIERVRALPGVESASLTLRQPFAIDYNRSEIYFPDRQSAGEKGTMVDVTSVAAEYFDTLGVSLREGRTFTSADTPKSPRVAIVSEAFARRFWPHESAIGKHFRTRGIDGPDAEIVGVSADYKVSTPGEAPTPYVHFAEAQRPRTGEVIMARTRGSATDLLAAMKRELLALEPDVVFLDDNTMEAQVDTTLLPARLAAIAVALVGIVAMALAAIGIYGVIAYSVARRTREIGIRMALGAEPASVLALVLRQGLMIVLPGLAVGALVAAGAARAMAGALYSVSAADPIAWSSAIGVLLVAAAAANLVPAARASRVAPSVALRTE